MRTLLFTLITLFTFSFSTKAQVDQSPEVGVIEHLGKKIPLDLKFVNDKSDTVTLAQVIDKPTIL
jgi:protein SCO1/2